MPLDKDARERSQAAKACAKSVDGLLKSLDAWWPAAQTAKIKNLLEQMPESCRRGYAKAMLGKSLSAAVKAHCLECVGWEREEVRRCTAPACPLFAYRPYKSLKDGDA